MNSTKIATLTVLCAFVSMTVAVSASAQNISSGQGATADTATASAAASAAVDAPPPASGPPAQTAAATEASSQLSEIVVTGTQIIRNGYEAPQPLTVVGMQDIQRDAPVNIADTVNKLPQLGLGNTSHDSNDSVSDGNAGVNNFNLLSLGAERTLVLLDGVRVAPGSITGFFNNGGAVDVNTFPDELIERVDVVTGGASSVYGSDAIAGVVNFILNKSFTGLQFNAQGGVTTYGDDRQYKGSITYGTGFSDNRGHILLSGGADYTTGIPNGAAARSWVNASYGTITNYGASAANGQPYYSFYNHVGNSYYTPGGLIESGPLTGTDFGPGGTPHSFTYGSPNDGYDMYGGNWQETEGVENFLADEGLDTQLSRQNLFARVSYDITDNVQIFAQFDFANTHAIGYCCDTSANFTIYSGNPFIPASVQTQMNNLGITSFEMGQDTSLGGPTGIAGANDNRRFDQYLVGVNGKFEAFGSHWTWDAYATRSTTTLIAQSFNDTILSNLALASDVVTNPATGLPTCASTLTNPNNGCVPYNPMGIGVNSQAALDYVSGSGWFNQLIAEDVGSFTFRGEPFSDWAGPVSLAFGAVHRNDSVSGSTDALDEANDFWVGNYHPTSGSYHVDEGFVETVVPLLKDLAAAKQLDFNGAVRETSYSTSGAVTTWKLGLSYSPYSDLRFRATRSRDIRAPNLGELFSAGQSGTITVTDPFKAGAVVPAIEETIGNQKLQPEDADGITAGLVFQPAWFSGFSFSFDWYHISIDNSIATASAQTEITECYDGLSVFCNFINQAHSPLIIDIEPANTQRITTQGFNIDATYTKRLSDVVQSWRGAMNLHLLATHIGNLLTVDPAGEYLQGAGANGAGALNGALWAPTWKYNVVADYAADAYNVSWTGRGFGNGVQNPDWIQCTTNCPNVVPPYYTINDNHMPGAFYMDVALTYHLSQGAVTSDLFLTVENIANKNPDVPIYFSGLWPAAYDYLGRMFRMGVRAKL